MKKYGKYLDILCLPHEEYKKIPVEYKKKVMTTFFDKWKKDHPHVNPRIRGDILIE